MTTGQDSLEHPAAKVTLQRPTDLSDRLSLWLRSSQQLAEAFSLSDVVTELQALDAWRRTPGFRLVFVGEFSRGKSTLINRLLDRALLPVRAIPTTATLTSIVASSEDCMVVRFADGRKEVRSMAESSWSDLMAIDPTGEDQDVLANVRLLLHHPWLAANDVELVDAPGAGDLNQRRAALVFELLSESDGTVVVVSATSPLSLTEQTFLEQEVMGRHIPRLLVVVSKLDTVPEMQRMEVLENIRQRVAKVSVALLVLPSHPVDGRTTEAEALQAVRREIEAMVAKEDRRSWRSRQVAGQTAGHRKHLIGIGEAGVAASRMSDTQRRQELRKAHEVIRDQELDWQRIQHELDERRLVQTKKLQTVVDDAKAELIGRLFSELRAAPNPKGWWEQELPARLRPQFAAFGLRVNDALMTAFGSDLEWLQGQVSHAFGTTLTRMTIELPETDVIVPGARALPLRDFEFLRKATKWVTAAVRILGPILIAAINSQAGPAGTVAAAAGSSASSFFKGVETLQPLAGSVQSIADRGADIIYDKQLEGQRKTVEAELQQTIEHAVDAYYDRVSDRIRQLYRQLIEELKREQVAWRAANTAVLEKSVAGPESDWQTLIDKASALRKDILTALVQ
jgi:GTP-binding protein EngB required for normal cell division